MYFKQQRLVGILYLSQRRAGLYQRSTLSFPAAQPITRSRCCVDLTAELSHLAPQVLFPRSECTHSWTCRDAPPRQQVEHLARPQSFARFESSVGSAPRPLDLGELDVDIPFISLEGRAMLLEQQAAGYSFELFNRGAKLRCRVGEGVPTTQYAR